jgi:hypothetical protein
MARNRGAFGFSGSLEIHKTAPLDARLLVPTLAELTQEETWLDGGGVWLYDNIVVTVQDQKGLYMLTNYDPVTAPDAYKTADNWVRIDAAAAKIDVVTDLTSTDDTKALAASQGKVLSDKIDEVKTSLSSVYSYKGSVDNYSDLPSEGNQVGFTYNVVNANGNIPAGTNYAWNGESWDALGGSVDLSVYYTKNETDGLITGAKDYAKDLVDTLSTTVGEHTATLNVINGQEGTEGSLLNTLKKAKDYTDEQLTGYVEKVEGSSLITNEKLTLIDTLDTRVTTLETATEDLTTLKAQIETNKTDIATLRGNSETEGSIDNKISNALSWEEII